MGLCWCLSLQWWAQVEVCVPISQVSTPGLALQLPLLQPQPSEPHLPELIFFFRKNLDDNLFSSQLKHWGVTIPEV